MIIPVDESHLFQAAEVHSVSWKDSHRAFCTPAFVELHTPERQREYLRETMARGSRLYMLVEGEPLGIVSVTGDLIEDLYVLPEKQNRGYGTKLLRYAKEQCTGTPTLWILENNANAERLYRRMGFQPSGRRHSVPNGLDEVEFALGGDVDG